MKNVAKSLALCIALAGLPSGAPAQSIRDDIIAQLSAQGFAQFEVSRTFLGRTRILAFSDDFRRELVFNPVTGEILRDYWIDLDDGEHSAPKLVDPSSGSNGSGGDNSESGGGGEDDDDGDGEDDDSDDDDEDEEDEEDDEDDEDEEDDEDDDEDDEDDDD